MRDYSAGPNEVTSKSIDGITDLVVWAPIKEGFVDAFVNVTYESRLRLVAEALHNVRRSSREFELLEPYADTAKRILTLLDFRIGIVDRDIFAAHKRGEDEGVILRPRKFMYLVATFDGPWEPYIRQIWNPLGAFLDLVLCNCEGYKPAGENPFEVYAKWVRDHQLDSAIFYSTSGLTVVDGIYLAEIETIGRSKSGEEADIEIAGHTIQTPDAAAAEVRKNDIFKERLSLGMEALNVLYKLTDFYPPVSSDPDCEPDGRFLFRASHELLRGFDTRELSYCVRDTYCDAISWFEADEINCDKVLDDRSKPAQPCVPREPEPDFVPAQIQKGVLSGYDEGEAIITHGGLMLSRIAGPEAFRDFLKLMTWSWEGGPQPAIGEYALGAGVFVNLAFSYNGLERLGVPEAQLLEFPKEFREGMKERAPMIGDKFQNHPRNWTLPARNWPREGAETRYPIETSEIDFVIQIRASLRKETDPTDVYREHAQSAANFKSGLEAALKRIIDSLPKPRGDQGLVGDPIPEGPPIEAPEGLLPWMVQEHPDSIGGDPTLIDCFYLAMQELGEYFGFEVLGIEDMFRPDIVNNDTSELTSIQDGRTTTDHFGFKDGISQPTLVDCSTELKRPTDVLKGDLVYGYENSLSDPHLGQTVGSLRFNGSYMVVRKIEQKLDALAKIENSPGVIERMVGRTKEGAPLVGSGSGNNFNYKQDKKGVICPLPAHIRLANPRADGASGRKLPKIVRRGMSYGYRGAPGDDQDRGIVFLAYCASIAEQYEVIQRWLNLGNITHASSAQNDPLTGVHPRSGTRTFRYLNNGGCTVDRIDIEDPLTRLHWGEYFFLPSRKALETCAKGFKASREDAAERGQAIIDQIATMHPIVRQEEWKRLLEDYLTKDPTRHNRSPLVWQAIQAKGGAIRLEHGIPYDEGVSGKTIPAVIVTDATAIHEVLVNSKDPATSACPYSSREQLKRSSAHDAFGAIYVSVDQNIAPYPANEGRYGSYAEESPDANAILMGYRREPAFHAGYKAGRERLKELIALSPPAGSRVGTVKIDLANLYIQPALGSLCHDWFGIPDENQQFFQKRAWNWSDDDRPSCPGDFLAPSRHSFYPRPTKAVTWMGKKHGRNLRAAVRKYIDHYWDDPNGLPGTVAGPLGRAIRAKAAEHPEKEQYYKELLGRNLVGIMIGALPPMEANLRAVFFEGIDSGKLWQWQDAYKKAQERCKRDKKCEPPPADAPPWDAAENTLELPVKLGMCVRPAPDLIYRMVEADKVAIGNVTAEKGDLVILCLSAATQETLRSGSPDVSLVFGGTRKVPTVDKADNNVKQAHHACPAQEMAMGGMMGILAALFDAGRIQSLPASLIVQLSDWPDTLKADPSPSKEDTPDPA